VSSTLLLFLLLLQITLIQILPSITLHPIDVSAELEREWSGVGVPTERNVTTPGVLTGQLILWSTTVPPWINHLIPYEIFLW